MELGDQMVSNALKGGVSVAECVLLSGADLSVRVRMGKTELVEQSTTRSVGLRVMKGKRVVSTSTSDLTRKGLERFLKDALEFVELAEEDECAGPAPPSLLCNPAKQPDLELFDPCAHEFKTEQAIALAAAAEKEALAFDSRITNSEGATFACTLGGRAMILSGGFRGISTGSYYSLSVSPLAADQGGKNRRGCHWTAKRFLNELDDPIRVGQEAARRTLEKLGARSIPTCEVSVIFDPEAARTLLSMLSCCIMGNAIWKKASYLADREGTQVASSMVTILDDPLLLRAPGSRAFDGEGLASRINTILENGILRTYLCDSYAARKLSRQSTANAFRGRGGEVSPGVTNLVLKPGVDSKESILKGTPRGLYVTSLMGFGFNPVTADFSQGASGFWIERGELAFPVSEVTISLNLDQLWQRVDAVGSDLDLRTSIAAPTIRVGKMTVAGE
ncbi:PmbA protein [Pajaroellobacter abortibovis]|uniref:PmbA protein n=1 Tax=Pajaroellobacter abortibovis TaxID=1882918 RepID=A0A1L6MZW2_9BACT|nr:PmbA protein [Pajaroellobacter abortibovis]